MPDGVIYVTGGTVQATPGAIYIPRQADEDLLQLCLEGTFAYVLSSRQVGKSSLMVRTAEHLATSGVDSAAVDLQQLGTNVTEEQWYYGVLASVADQLGLTSDLPTWWRQHSNLGMSHRLTLFFEQVVLCAPARKVVIFFDEIDTTLSLPFTDDFFVAIRYLYNKRSSNRELDRLSFVLIGTATPSDLIRDAKRTPFNIGRRVDLRDWSLEEALPLGRGLQGTDDVSSRVIRRVLDWTSGHPYLTQRLVGAVAELNFSHNPERVVDLVVAETFFGRMSELDSNLTFVRDMLTRWAPEPTRPGAAVSLYSKVRAGRDVRDDERSAVASHLKLSGIVARNEVGRLKVRNRIYSHVFNARWIKRQTPRLFADFYRSTSKTQRAMGAAGIALVASLLVVLGVLLAPRPTALPQVSVGDGFACQVHSPGGVLCWGNTSSGETEPPKGDFTQVSAGTGFACAVQTDASIRCWGDTSFGATRAPLGSFDQVSAGSRSACGVAVDGTAICWGDPSSGETQPPPVHFSDVSVGATSACGLRVGGSVRCWGDSSYGQLRAPSGHFTQVSAGRRFACGLEINGHVLCWGDPSHGETHAPAPANNSKYTQVSAGYGFACGIETNLAVVCWGSPHLGETRAPAGQYTQVSAGTSLACGWLKVGGTVCWGNIILSESQAPTGIFKNVSVGTNFACGVKTDATIHCWGDNRFGQSRAPLGHFTQISSGDRFACGLRTSGVIACWGDNTFGQMHVPPGRFRQVSTGSGFACGVKTDATIQCWGDNAEGQTHAPHGKFSQVSAGTGLACGRSRSGSSTTCWGSTSPEPPEFVTPCPPSPGCPSEPVPFGQVSAGSGFACGVLASDEILSGGFVMNGSAVCWGDTSAGETRPPSVGFSQISTGTRFACGIRAEFPPAIDGVRTSGVIACWGDRTFGETRAPRGRFIQVSAGEGLACAVEIGGRVRCWPPPPVGVLPT